MNTTTIEIWGFDMEVIFEYDAGQEGVGEYVTIDNVIVGGVEIINMLSEHQTKRIEEETLRAYLKECEADNLDFAVERYEANRSFMDMEVWA